MKRSKPSTLSRLTRKVKERISGNPGPSSRSGSPQRPQDGLSSAVDQPRAPTVLHLDTTDKSRIQIVDQGPGLENTSISATSSAIGAQPLQVHDANFSQPQSSSFTSLVTDSVYRLNEHTRNPVLDQSTNITPAERIESIGIPVTSTASPPDLLPGQAARETVPAPGRERWAGLGVLMSRISSSAVRFGPFAAVIEMMSTCEQAFEEQSRRRADYDQLAGLLNDLLVELDGLFDGSAPPVMTLSMNRFTEGMKREMEVVQSKLQCTAGIGQYFIAEGDVDDILERYRRVQNQLERFKLNANLNTWALVEEQVTESRLGHLPNSRSAKYRSAGPERTGCMQNTRVDVLTQIDDWIRDSDSKKVYWLNGMAGAGKSAIACTLCERLEAEHKLAASFFCSRQLPECRDVQRVIPTIAYQLARSSLPFCHALSEAIKRNPDAHNQPLKSQMVDLIVDPLNSVRQSLPEGLVVVIDALDECDDNGGSKLLDVLLSHAGSLPVKFLVTSRPDQRIVERMSESGDDKSELHLHKLDAPVVQQDIRIYLTTSLHSYVPITNEEIEVLVKRSGVLFIYAATVVRHVMSNTNRRRQRLRKMLDASSAASSEHEEGIDELYMTILQLAFVNDASLTTSDREEMQLVLNTIVCAREPLLVHTIADLLGLESDESVDAVVGSLSSVLYVSAERTVTTLHESFPDFLLDRRRSGSFHCSTGAQHAELTIRCFEQIERVNPPYNICRLESSYVLDSHVPDMQDRIKRYISGALLYACTYWVDHLKLAAQSSVMLERLNRLLEERGLLWMEVMNVTGRVHEGVWGLYAAYGHLEKNKTDRRMYELARDSYMFMASMVSSPVRHSTPHIYLSALSWWPRESAVCKRYARYRRQQVSPETTALDARPQQPFATNKTSAIIHDVAYSPNGVHIVAGLDDATVRIWHAHGGQLHCEPLQGHTSGVRCVAYSPDGLYIVSGSHDMTLRLWDARTGQPVGQPLQGHTSYVISAAYSLNGAYIVSGSADRTIRIWDARTGQVVGQPLQGHTDWVTCAAYSPDGSYIVSGSWDKTLRTWDAHTGQAVGRPLQGHLHYVTCAAYSPDGTYIVSGSYDKSIRIWDARTGQSVGQPLQGHTNYVTCTAYSPDGAYIVSGSHDMTVCIWDANTSQAVGQSLQGHTGGVTGAAYSPNGAYIVSGSIDQTIRIWDTRAGQEPGQLLHGHTSTVSCTAYSPDGAYIVSGSADKTICIWNARTGQAVGQPIQGHHDRVRCVAYSPEGAYIVSGSDDRTLRIWDACTGQPVGQPLQGDTDWVTCAAYSPDGAYVVSGSYDRTIRIWDVSTSQAVGQPLRGHTDWVTCTAYSPDGAHIVSCSHDMTIRIWDARTGQPVAQPLHGHTGGVTSVAYSPDGACFVSGSYDMTIRIWDACTGQAVGQPLEGHTGRIICAAYSPDGQYIVSGSHDTTIRMWDVRTGQPVGQPLFGHTGWVTCVACSPVGTHVVSGSDDCNLRIWDTQFHTDCSASLLDSSPDIHSSRSVSSVSHGSWNIDHHGWVVDGTNLLMWIPPDLVPQLMTPRCTHLISRYGKLLLEFDEESMGAQWSQMFEAITVEDRDS